MRWCLFIAAIASSATQAFGHEGGHDSYANLSKVVITTQGDRRIIEANGLPDHEPGQFPNRGNPNSIREQRYRFEMPRQPQANQEPLPVRRYLFGVAINGVVFDPGTAEVWLPGARIVNRPGPGTRLEPGQDRNQAWNYEGMGRMNLGIDESHAHVQPTGAYHYHGLPTGLIDRLQKEKGTDQMLLIGYAADGYPIYSEYGHEKADDASSPLTKLRSSYQMKKGRRPTGENGPGGKYDGTFVQDYEFVPDSGELDQCNGRTGVTPEYPEGTYYYVVTDSFPFIPRFFHGQPDSSFEKQGPPAGPSRRGGRRGPPPPPNDRRRPRN
jgi:YHYH protein